MIDNLNLNKIFEINKINLNLISLKLPKFEEILLNLIKSEIENKNFIIDLIN